MAGSMKLDIGGNIRQKTWTAPNGRLLSALRNFAESERYADRDFVAGEPRKRDALADAQTDDPLAVADWVLNWIDHKFIQGDARIRERDAADAAVAAERQNTSGFAE